jgi:hypothetical protein
VRRLTAWVGGVVGGITAYRLLRRRPRAALEHDVAEPEAAAEPDDRAEELRAKLAESRTAEPAPEPVVEEQPASEPVTGAVVEEEPAAEPESPEERRREVHEEGRAALDEMKSDGAA